MFTLRAGKAASQTVRSSRTGLFSLSAIHLERADQGQAPHGGSCFCGGGGQRAVFRPCGRFFGGTISGLKPSACAGVNNRRTNPSNGYHPSEEKAVLKNSIHDVDGMGPEMRAGWQLPYLAAAFGLPSMPTRCALSRCNPSHVKADCLGKALTRRHASAPPVSPFFAGPAAPVHLRSLTDLD